MPVLRVPLDDDLERAVDTIERTSRIVATAPDGDHLLVFVEPRRDLGRETR